MTSAERFDGQTPTGLTPRAPDNKITWEKFRVYRDQTGHFAKTLRTKRPAELVKKALFPSALPQDSLNANQFLQYRTQNGITTVVELKPTSAEAVPTHSYPFKQQTSPAESVVSHASCPRLSRFSWQSSTLSTATPPQQQLPLKRRHIEIRIPSCADEPKTPPPQSAPANVSTHWLAGFPLPPPTRTPPLSQGQIQGSPFESPVERRDRRVRSRNPHVAPPTPRDRVQKKRSRPRLIIKPDTPPETAAAKMGSHGLSNTGTGAEGHVSPANGGPPNHAPPAPASQASYLPSLLSNVHRTTGERPPPLVGASTTICGDKLYVFGGRRVSRQRTQTTNDLYSLDLMSRHWQKIEANGDVPVPRYFHSMCALGDTKLVCYGGMTPIARLSGDQSNDDQRSDSSIQVMSDVHILDIASATWKLAISNNAPAGRYAHCAAILPSFGIFTSNSGTSSGPADGRGGAEMVVVGGQDATNHYIEQISVFNLRSLKWTTTAELGKSCGAYRSVVTPLTGINPSRIGQSSSDRSTTENTTNEDNDAFGDDGYATLIYSNYNFLDVKLELQIRMPDGTLVDKQMQGSHAPPGLRFPNGDVINNHFVVSGTFLTSTRQEYALWALDLRTLTWARIDAGPGGLTSGSWNRGILWKKRNTFVVLGDRRRALADDYNHRRLNFTNMCTVELEAYGLFDNPVTSPPSLEFTSCSCPFGRIDGLPARERPVASDNVHTLGKAVVDMKEIADMEFLALGGQRVLANFHIVLKRWGPYLSHLLEGQAATLENGVKRNTLRTLADSASRNSSVTITPSIAGSSSNTVSGVADEKREKPSPNSAVSSSLSDDRAKHLAQSLSYISHSRVLFLPHTESTIRALVYYLYTWTLPPPGTPLCTAQILCSLLQIARPYRVNGLLEITVERLHQILDARSTAAIFNAAAMAAGSGDGVAFAGAGGQASSNKDRQLASTVQHQQRIHGTAARRLNRDDGNTNDSDTDTSANSSAMSSEAEGGDDLSAANKVWTGEYSAVVGLQKRGLRGLMEGRKLREKVAEDGAGPSRNQDGGG